MVEISTMSSITVASPFVRQALEGVIDAGFDLQVILKSCGISSKVLREDKSRISHLQFTLLCQTLDEIMKDEAWGLLENPHPPNSLKIMGRSSIGSDSIGESFFRVTEFYNVLGDGFTSEFYNDGTTSIYRLNRLSAESAKNTYIVEDLLMRFHRYHSWLAKKIIPITKVCLDYPAPKFSQEYRHLFYNAPIHFDQPSICIQFPSAVLQWRIKQTESTLVDYIKNYPLDFFLDFSCQDDLSYEIRRFVSDFIRRNNHAPGMGAVASNFSLHPQTLRRRLDRESTTYMEIKSELRRDMAIHYLNQDCFSVDEVAFKVGFSEASAFIKAFRTWTGLTPLNYRKR